MGYPEYKVRKKHIWQTANERIQDAPLYHLDWNLGQTIEINSWRGIIDIENFNLGANPGPSMGTPVFLKLTGSKFIATDVEDFYIQLTPYYNITLDTDVTSAIPYLLPAGALVLGVSDIAIYNMSTGGNWDAPFYIYYELGVNFKGS